MAIISENEKTAYRGYSKTQVRYAMTYVLITSVVLIILNIYCSGISQKLFYQSKESSMIEKCQLASDEIAILEVLNSTTVAGVVSQMESLKITRLIVTDQSGTVLYDSSGADLGNYLLLPEILQAVAVSETTPAGNDVFPGIITTASWTPGQLPPSCPTAPLWAVST